MITLSGKSVFGGVAIGKIAFYKRQEKQVRRYHAEDTEAEVSTPTRSKGTDWKDSVRKQLLMQLPDFRALA